jgi:RNA-directed DNA polymerase
MSLKTPDKIRDLQIKLYRKAKNEPGYRFYQLYDKVYREDILLHAYVLAKANDGAPGVDGESFENIESRGRGEWLNGLGKDLHDKTYKPQPVRRKMIDKPGGGKRELGIPTIRDRVAQTAAKLVLEPIWEADLEPNAYGYRVQSNRAGIRPNGGLAHGRGRVRRMRSRRWMSCCMRAIRISWTRICPSTSTRFRIPNCYSAWHGESSMGRCCI